jgi:hypothetical protein
MDKEALLRRIRVRRVIDITARSRDLQQVKVEQLKARLAIIREQERETLDQLGREGVADKLLIVRLQEIGRQRLILTGEIEKQDEIARQLGRRAKGAERLFERLFRIKDTRRG